MGLFRPILISLSALSVLFLVSHRLVTAGGGLAGAIVSMP
jgi:hypothetical protein